MIELYLLYRLAFLSFFMILITRPKFSVLKSRAILALCIVLLWLVNSAIYETTNLDFLNSVYPLTVTLPAFFCFWLVSRGQPLKILFSFLTVCNFGMLTTFVGQVVLYLTGSFPAQVAGEIVSIVLLLTLIILGFRKPYFEMSNALEKNWAVLCALPSLLAIIIYLLMNYPTEISLRPEIIPLTTLIFLLMFIFYIIVYANFKTITRYYQLMYTRESLLQHAEQQKKEYNALLEQVDTVRIYRHDMRHHLLTMNTLLQEKNLSEAQAYLLHLSDGLTKTIVEKYCENYGINIVLSNYISKAREESIQVSCQAVIPEFIWVDNIELGSVFANALDNAINACKKIENPEERRITINTREQHNQIFIQISNTYQGEIRYEGEFPVSDQKEHGIGTRSIAAIADKYDGVFSFSGENGTFKTSVILKYPTIKYEMPKIDSGLF